CGNCAYCLSGQPNLCGGAETARPLDAKPRLSKGGERLLQFAHLSAFAERMLVHENALVKIRPDMPLDRAALIGCGVTVRCGAAPGRAAARSPGLVRRGDAAVGMGGGGAGLAAIRGCRTGGASRIVAVDTVPWKLELARKLGATDAIDAKQSDPVMGVFG